MPNRACVRYVKLEECMCTTISTDTDIGVLTTHLMMNKNNIREGWKSVYDCAVLRRWITRSSDGHY